jgi:cupin fold WbuC family metalloprotein
MAQNMKVETDFTPQDFIEDSSARTKSFYAKGEDVGVSMDLIREMLAGSRGNNCRLCLHQGATDGFHQMLILEYRGKSFPAHRHPTKSEGYHLVEGEMALLLYKDTGDTDRVIHLTPGSPIARVGPNTFHELKIVSPYAIYHETKPGPFERENDKIMAPWVEQP